MKARRAEGRWECLCVGVLVDVFVSVLVAELVGVFVGVLVALLVGVLVDLLDALVLEPILVRESCLGQLCL